MDDTKINKNYPWLFAYFQHGQKFEISHQISSNFSNIPTLMPFARDISAWTYLYGRNILYYFKKKSTFSYFRRISRFVCEKSEASLHPKKRKDIFIPPNVFPRKICLPSKYRATSYNRILNVTLSLSFSLSTSLLR